MKIYTSEDILEIQSKTERLTRNEQIWFQNNFGVRKAGITYCLNNQELKEFARCFGSIEYFSEHNCNIKKEDGNVGAITLRDYQKDILKKFNNKYNIIFRSRQMGLTAVMCIQFLHYLLFNDNKQIVIIAYNMETAKETIRKFKDIYKLMPFYLKQGVVNWNEKQVVFENGSRIYIVGRARDINPEDVLFKSDIFYMEDLSKVPDSIMVPIYMEINKKMKDDARIIIASGPNGINFFYDLVMKSELPVGHPDKNLFNTTRLYWWQVPGRDAKWVQEHVNLIGGYAAFNKEFGLQFFSDEYKFPMT